MKIKDLRESDISKVSEIENKYFSLPWTKEQLSHVLASDTGIFLGAYSDNDELMGYVNLTYVLDEGYMGNVAVDENFRRIGAGEALLNELKIRCLQKDLAFITLEVRAGNIPAISLYKKLGYEEVGRRKNYYVNPSEDAVLMTLYLS